MKPPLKNILLSKYSLLALAIIFYLLSLVFNKLYTNRSSVAREVKVAERYLHRQQNDFDGFLKDTALVNRLLTDRASLNEFTRLARKSYSIFLYSAEEFGVIEVKYWNKQLVAPSQTMLMNDDGEGFEHLSNGWYFTIKKSFAKENNSGKVVAYAMIPVRSEFYIENGYLPRKFVYSSTSDKRVLLTEQKTDFPVKSLTGKTIFHLEKKASGAVPYNDLRTILLRMAAVLFFFLFIHVLVESVAAKYGAWRSVGLLALLLFLFRAFMYYFPSTFNLRQFELFDPSIYGSNFIQRSLGDLLVNAALFCWIILFAWSKSHHRQDPTEHFTPRLKWITAVISLLFLILSTFMLAGVIKSLVADSKISFDVTDFFGLTIYTLIGFIVLACLSLSYYYFSQLLFRFIFPAFEGKNYLIYFAISVVGLIWLTVGSTTTEVLFNLPVLCWLLIYTWFAGRRGIVINHLRINIAGTLSWIFIFSLSIATIMLIENNKVEWGKRKRMADKLATQADPKSETMMSIAIRYLDQDFLQENFHRFKNPDEGRMLRDSIIRNNYKGYLDKYDTRLYIYDSSDAGLYNDDPETYETLNTILKVQAKESKKTEGLYYYETSFDKFNYITRRDVNDSAGEKLGSFFIVSNLKNFSQEELIPELFKQFNDNDAEESPIFSTAIYDSGSLASPLGKYPFPTSLTKDQIPKEEFHKEINGDFDELWYKAGNDKVVVIARKKETTIETITLFSYIFCSFLFLVALVQFIQFIVKTVSSKKRWRDILQLNIRSQVHSTIIFISVFSFLIIGVATISFFISRYNRNNNDRLSRTMKIMVNEMEKRLSEHNTFDDVVKLYDSVSSDGLQTLVNEVSDIHGVDVNVYDLKGELQVSSQSEVYTKGVLSKRIDPIAFYHLSRMRQVQHAQQERISNFSYLSIYSPVRDDKKVPYAYINIPYFTSNPELRQEISNFLVTIINLNAFIFLIAGLIALVITNRITRSFSLISDKMKEVNLGQMNEEIVWNRNDEIGELVQEYNKMVAKLGESATALAKSEREGAWREMARQVAHEIKNPLTPMKLSIQYLQKAISNNQENVKELSANVANTLVEQIDHLSKIAADFSQFANIGNTKVELFDLHDVIASLKGLFHSDQDVDMQWTPVNDKVMVNADRTQMNRLFTNLFTNAVEACRDNGRCRIEVSEMKEDGKVVISIKDNGEGIPSEMQSRIFMPNFTTKSSGTGLGLAMVKGIVEQAKGNIWFETEQGKGTTFHVELPVAD